MNTYLFFDLDGTLVDASFPDNGLFLEVATLEKLAIHQTLGIITGSSRETLNYILDTYGIRKYFDANLLITADDFQGHKASGVPFQIALSHIPQGATVHMIGDSEGDETGCKVAGIPCTRIISMSPESLGAAIQPFL